MLEENFQGWKEPRAAESATIIGDFMKYKENVRALLLELVRYSEDCNKPVPDYVEVDKVAYYRKTKNSFIFQDKKKYDLFEAEIRHDDITWRKAKGCLDVI
jgi:hypothetical protein